MPGEGRMDYEGHKGAFESDENIFTLIAMKLHIGLCQNRSKWTL